MQTKPSAPNRCNLRNENLGLRALLKIAIQALHQSGCMVPLELQRWLKAQQRVVVKPKMKAEITVDMAHEVRGIE